MNRIGQENMTSVTLHKAVMLDDGDYFLRCSAPNESSAWDFPVYLRRRCYGTRNTPDGYECVGRFECDDSGRWCASINIRTNARADGEALELGRFATWIDAIHVLWSHRHEACASH